MDINIIRAAITLCAFAGFLAIVWWAYAPARKAQWEEKGKLDE